MRTFPKTAFVRATTSRDPEPSYQMAAEAHTAVKALYDFMLMYREVRIELDDGSQMVVLARDIVPGSSVASHLYFACSNISEGDTFAVRVNAGAIDAPDISDISDTSPGISKYLDEIPVPGGDFTVQDGWKIWLKVTVTTTDASHDYDNATDTDPVDTLLTVQTTIKGRHWYGVSGEVQAGAVKPSGSATEAYLTIADISITNGVMEIKPRRVGAVTCPDICATFGANPDLTGETIEHDVCVDGSAVTEVFLAKVKD